MRYISCEMKYNRRCNFFFSGEIFGGNISYNELLARKNRALAVTLLICILLRSIANAFFIEWVKVIPMAVGGNCSYRHPASDL